jgi:hypothetical protein
MTFENKISSQDIYYSQYIASWVKSGGNFDKEILAESGYIVDIVWLGEFRGWLRSIGLPENEVYEIAKLADDGKLELEESAKAYLKGNNWS